MAYMDYREYKSLMDDAGYKESETVKLFLNRAAHYARIQKKMQSKYQTDPRQILKKFIKEYDSKRIESVWNAYWFAEQEQQQGWRFIEDGEDYLSSLLIKYEGDLTKVTVVEKISNELIVTIDKLRREQLKGEWRG